MRLLTQEYFLQNKRLVLFGAASGVVAAIILRGSLVLLGPAVAFFLLGFPYIAKTQAERLLRLTFVGSYLSLALVYFSKTFLPLAWIGFAGISILSAVTICLRYNPPATKLETGTEKQNADGI